MLKIVPVDNVNMSVLLNEGFDIIDQLLGPDLLVDGLAPVVLHVLAVLHLLHALVDQVSAHGLVSLIIHDFCS